MDVEVNVFCDLVDFVGVDLSLENMGLGVMII